MIRHMKEKILDVISITIVLILCLAFVVKFGGPSILKLYVERGIGNCQTIPILCMAPEEEIVNPKINKEYIAEFLPYKFPKIQVLVPRGFTVSAEKITKVYYKRQKRKHSGAVVYLLYEKPNFFMGLFPQLKKRGIKNNYEFFQRTMAAKLKDVKTLSDALFVIIKSVFTPDIGNQHNVKIIKFIIDDKRGFINYNLEKTKNYFDCNIIDPQDNFFKIYIKDERKQLDLDKVFAIIFTVKKAD